MAKKKLSAQQAADRALCPVAVAGAVQLRVSAVAAAMRRAEVTEQLNVKQAKGWRAHPDTAPEWFQEVLAEAAVRRAQRAERKERAQFEREHRMLLLEDQVRDRLLAGRRIRGEDAEWIASDFAFRAMKELVRADGDTDALSALELAALRWARVDPADSTTWFLTSGNA